MSDLYDGTENRKFGRIYKKETPDILEAFVAFDNAVFAEEGRAIPLKFRELMALSVAFTTQCSFCIDAHTKGAVKAGATDAEIAEAAWIAAALRAGGRGQRSQADLRRAPAPAQRPGAVQPGAGDLRCAACPMICLRR